MSVILSTMNVCMVLQSWSTGKILVSIVTQGKTADNPPSRGTDSTSAKGLFISWLVIGNSDASSCTQITSVETGSVGEPGLFLEHFVMCTWERQRKGMLGLWPVGSKWSAVHGSGTCNEPHSKELSIGKAVTVFGFYKSMTREARRRERKLSLESWHWHQVLLEPGHSFTGSKSWTPWNWQLPLNRAPSQLSPHLKGLHQTRAGNDLSWKTKTSWLSIHLLS